MNPACRLNLNSRECKAWMTAAFSHCVPLLPTAEQASLWDSWWPDELPAPYKTWVSTMSAFDCHRLRKAVARQVADRIEMGLHAEASSHTALWGFCRWVMVLAVLFTVLISMVFALRILFDAARGRRSVTPSCSPSPHVDVESLPCNSFNQPRSFISFGNQSDPRAHYGPSHHQNLLRANTIANCSPKEVASLAVSSPHSQSSRWKKSSKK